MREQTLQNQVRLYLSKQDFIVFRANVGKVRMSDGRFFDTGLPKGFSDLFAVKDGRAYFFEVKVKPNKPSSEQLNFIEQMRKRGCGAWVIYSVEDLKNIIKGEAKI